MININDIGKIISEMLDTLNTDKHSLDFVKGYTSALVLVQSKLLDEDLRNNLKCFCGKMNKR